MALKTKKFCTRAHTKQTKKSIFAKSFFLFSFFSYVSQAKILKYFQIRFRLTQNDILELRFLCSIISQNLAASVSQVSDV